MAFHSKKEKKLKLSSSFTHYVIFLLLKLINNIVLFIFCRLRLQRRLYLPQHGFAEALAVC